MHFIQALNKTLENGETYKTNIKGENIRVYKGSNNDSEFIRIIVNGKMIEISLEAKFTKGT